MILYLQIVLPPLKSSYNVSEAFLVPFSHVYDTLKTVGRLKSLDKGFTFSDAPKQVREKKIIPS